MAGFNLWWRWNDGMRGHAWLAPAEMRGLIEEMLLQGMAWQQDPAGAQAASPARRAGRGIAVSKLLARGGAVVTPQEIEEAMEVAGPEPLTLPEPKLWHDWISFLDGARQNGGILVR